MQLIRPLPRRVTRPLSWLVVAAWAASMGMVVQRSYLQASFANLATDLARYGSAAQWRGVYYRGEKIGFTVSQTVATDEGFELQEDARLQMSLLGATTFAAIRTTALVDHAFALRSFDFSLDPGTGPISVRGELSRPSGGVPVEERVAPASGARRGAGSAERTGRNPTSTAARLTLTIMSGGTSRTETRELAEPPALMLTLARRLASEGLTPGARHQWTMFDPATLRNAPVTAEVGARELVSSNGRPIPAFRVDLSYSGLRTSSWVTDTGEVVREESPLGLLAVTETADSARLLAVPRDVQVDLLEASAVVPVTSTRIEEPRDVRRLRLRLDGADLSGPDVQGAGQGVQGNVVEIVDARTLAAGPAVDDLVPYLTAEPLIESDALEIRDEASRALAGLQGARSKAERLTRYVNALLEKKPTVSVPSALEVLRTRVGDCNEHTALFVALARAGGIPARIAVGLAAVRNAFYYHAWPEVWVDEGPDRGLWLPVDPTFNQFPADATHVRLARGGLDKQAAIVPLIGRLEMTVLEVELAPGAQPALVGGPLPDIAAPAIAVPRRQTRTCWFFGACRGGP